MIRMFKVLFRAFGKIITSQLFTALRRRLCMQYILTSIERSASLVRVAEDLVIGLVVRLKTYLVLALLKILVSLYNSTTTYPHASTALHSREMLLLLCIPIMNIPISKQHDQHSQEPNDRAPIPALYPDMARL